MINYNPIVSNKSCFFFFGKKEEYHRTRRTSNKALTNREEEKKGGRDESKTCAITKEKKKRTFVKITKSGRHDFFSIYLPGTLRKKKKNIVRKELSDRGGQSYCLIS